MSPTRIRLLLGIAAVSAALTWSALRVWTAGSRTLPQVTWGAAVVLGVFGAAVLGAAVVLRPRLRRHPGHRPMPPLVAARFAALALASSRAGAALVGLYGGYLLTVADDLESAYRRQLAVAAGACLVAAVLLVVAGLVLERVCRLPPDDEDERADPAPPAQPAH